MKRRQSGSLRRHFLMGCVLIGGMCGTRADAWRAGLQGQAGTLAEVFIETNRLRVELEIGMEDLEAFGNLLPEDLYARMNPDGRPHEQRLRAFFEQDFVIGPDGSAPWQGRLDLLRPRQRVNRDEITGEPLPVAEGESEVFVSATLVYPWADRPEDLTFRPPMTAGLAKPAVNIGFVVYHLGLMVNEPRYLGGEETLRLDWEDPWFTRFDNPALKRRMEAPLSAFLYVDPHEVRQEILVRPRDLASWFDLGLKGGEVIAVEDQGALKEKSAAFLAVMNPVTIDGRSIEPVLDSVHFIQQTARQTRVIDPPEELPEVSATLGVIFSYPLTGLPRHVFMEWELFSDHVTKVAASASDEAGTITAVLDARNPVLEWRNFQAPSSRETWVELEAPPAPDRMEIPVLSLGCGLWAAVWGVRMVARRGARRWRTEWVVLGGLVVGGLLAWPVARVPWEAPWSRAPEMTSDQAREVMLGLLHNIYGAFDYREEARIYDVLARSVSGELLTRTYLETRQALELENQGGSRTKVKRVELMETTTRSLADSVGFTARCTWNVTGTVGHWGHLHQRRNQYEAEFRVEPVDGVWKLTGLELLSEQRL